jgi:Xaa-Pro aminopeptidase
VPNSVYYDITWTGFIGKAVPDRIQEIFQVVRAARDAGIRFVEDSIAGGKQISGWQVDDPVRETITKAGYGKYFVHRTGHSIATDVHGNGPNMDNLEVHDERRILPNSCFSIEPGIYLAEFGVRSEVNMLVHSKSAEVTGRMQKEIVLI